MLDLKVEVAHPPSHKPALGRDVGGVIRAVLYPVNVVFGLCDVEMCVAHSKVGKDISAAHAKAQHVHAKNVGGGVPKARHEGVPAYIPERNPTKFCPVLGANDVTGVKKRGPAKSNQKACYGSKQERLRLEPVRLEASGLDVLGDLLVERDKGQGVQVDIVFQLLRGSVVLVVLVTPPRAAHAAADTVRHFLQASIERDVTS
mmetsp:Transcript_18217/g.33689  ORF Transcript_18217/g.33689 Transcript_18217/m.33689 type:complete len:202 (+) Transcript_18217:258-863(+)